MTGIVSTSPLPEALVSAAVEIVDADALLLDPRVVAEIEDARPIDVTQLEDVVVGNAFEVPAEDLSGIDLVESLRIAPLVVGAPFAVVHRCAVSRHRHDHIVWAQIEVPGELDGGDDVGQSGDAEVVELADESRIDLPPASEVAAADVDCRTED